MAENYKFGSKEYFKKLYQNSDEPWGISRRASQKHRYITCMKILKNYSDNYKSILDIGCSQGQFTILLKEVASEITAIDICDTAVQRAKENFREYKNIKFEVGNLKSLKYGHDSFDLITALEVLYYLKNEDRTAALKEVKRVLKSGGYLLISAKIDNPPYFRIDEFYNLISKHFKIEQVSYGYYRCYSYFENKLIRLHGKINKPFVRKLINFILLRKVLVSIFNFLTRILLGKKRSVTKMHILAKKVR